MLQANDGRMLLDEDPAAVSHFCQQDRLQTIINLTARTAVAATSRPLVTDQALLALATQ